MKLAELPRGEVRVAAVDGKELYPHQSNLVALPNSVKYLLISLPTGTGKCLTSLMRASHVGFKKLLIVGPQKLKKNWRREVMEAYGREPLIYWGTKKQREKLRAEIPNYDVIYTNYEQVEEFRKYAPRFDHVIIDEIHIVANYKTDIHKQLYDMVRNIPYRTGLSATPLRLKMINLWGVIRLLDETLAGNRHHFVDRYEEVLATIPIRTGNYVIYKPILVKPKNQEELQDKVLSTIMYRIPKSSIVDFKDLIELVDVELTPRQLKAYNECLRGIVLDLTSGSLEIKNALARMTRLLQISEGMFNLDEIHRDSGKLLYLEERLKYHVTAGDQVVVCSRFEPITREVKALFPERCVLYTGQVSDKARNFAEWAFQGCSNAADREEYERFRASHREYSSMAPGDAQIFAATHSLQSMIGINLDKAHHVYFTSFDWNPDVIFQARDRVSRLTQTEDTQTYFICSDSTIERKALRKILLTYEATCNLLDGKESTSSKLARELVNLVFEQNNI